MKVVIDTNVFVEACIGTGSSCGIIGACLRGQMTPQMGTTLFNEYEDVLSRTAIFARSRLDQQEREHLLDIFLSKAQWVRVYFAWRPNLRDEGDNHLVELALAAQAEAIITRNLKDFRGSDLRFPELRIVAPEAFMEKLQR